MSDWKAKRERTAFLALEDGTIFRGRSVGAPADALAEAVFNTGMTGYQEILSDPSYAGQFVVMTYPEIGNVGINREDMESRQFFLSGLVMHEMNKPSNWRCDATLADALRERGIPALDCVDTRALAIRLRSKGAMRALLHGSGAPLAEDEAVRQARAWEGLDGKDYAARVTSPAPYRWDPDGWQGATWGAPAPVPGSESKTYRVVAFDYGIKWNILRSLRANGMEVEVVPAATSAEDVLARAPDGVFFSNGPADPAAVTYAAEAARKLVGKAPLMGICLGHQLLSLACGAKTYRLKFGHHGCNHPVKDLATGAVEITSQNHNFAVDPRSAASTPLEVTHINLNDSTVEGVRHRSEPLFAVQYHPEAAPGPHDSAHLFGRFRRMIAEGRA